MKMDIAERILYEDNHLIIVNKESSEIVQGDKTGDAPLGDIVGAYIKKRDKKPGNVFIGLPHRLDRPTSGIVILAKTSKALSRMNELFRKNEVCKTYWAVLCGCPEKTEDTLNDSLRRDRKQNKSYTCVPGREDSKKASLSYRILLHQGKYSLAEVDLHTGRHHQIRVQFSARGFCIKGDLKYGASKANPGGSIHLHARKVTFIHPVKKEALTVIAPVPFHDLLWREMEREVEKGHGAGSSEG